MRLSPTAVVFAVACIVFSAGAACADTAVTIDGAPVSGAINKDGHILVPFRAPMQQIGATVVWSDKDRTGVASKSGTEIIRTQIDSTIAIISGNSKSLTVAPVLIEPQHLEYVPVELLPQISHAKLTIATDLSSAAVTDFDLAGVTAVGSEAGSTAIGSNADSNDPGGKVLLVWVWLLPFSGLLALGAYLIAVTQVNRSFAAAAARRKRRTQ